MAWGIQYLAAQSDSIPGFAIDLVLKSSLILGITAALALALRRRSAATRHGIWLLGLMALFLLPLFSLALPAWRIPIVAPASAPAQLKAIVFSNAGEGRSLSERAGLPNGLEWPEPTSAAIEPNAQAPSSPTDFGGRQIAWMLAASAWVAGFLLMMMPLLLGCLATVYLRRRTVPFSGSRIETIAASMAQQLGIRRSVKVLKCDRASMPMTWGVRLPVVLLPVDCERWPLARLRLVLVHELAHVQRFDCLTQAFIQFLRAFYWFHPLVWLAQRQARLEQEGACDDVVLNAGLDAEYYATQLLSFSAGLPARFLLSSVASAMARKRTLERRLLAILDSTRDRRPPRRPVWGFVLAASIACLAVVGPMRLSLKEPASAQASAVSLGSLTQASDSRALARTLDEVRAKIQAMAVDAPAEKVLLEGALRGMLDAMHDPYSSYLPASDAVELPDPSGTSMVGIGVQIRKGPAGIVIVTPLPGSPARQAGLRPGDTIVSINSRSTADMSVVEAVHAIRGAAGSSIDLEVQRAGSPRQLAIKRAAVTIPSIQGVNRRADDSWDHLIDPQEKIGYVQISAFHGGTEEELRQVIAHLEQQNMKGLLVDLRFCPGGFLNSAVGVAKLFLDQGTIVSMRGRQLHDSAIVAEGQASLRDLPLIVLVNEQTASAAEILAGALKENGRAVLLGSRTRGKGSVQTILNLGGEKGSIKLTTAQLYLPCGRMIQRVAGATEWGVDPSDGFYVPIPAKEIVALEERMWQRQILTPATPGNAAPTVDSADPQLAGALRAMTSKLSSGEFARVGRPIAEYAADFQKIQTEQARLRQKLAEIERELEVLGGKEPKNS